MSSAREIARTAKDEDVKKLARVVMDLEDRIQKLEKAAKEAPKSPPKT
jgi:hypothetical protein